MPSANSDPAGTVTLHVPAAICASYATPPTVTSILSNALPGSLTVPVNSGVVSLVTRSSTVTTGTVVSITSSSAVVSVPTLPSQSVAFTWTS